MKGRGISLMLCLASWCAAEGVPISGAMDARVKTLVYNENQVYEITARPGYQIDLQFGRDETISTISVGDSVSWQIVGEGSHVFVKPNVTSARTNMAVLTDKRVYQFNLATKNLSSDDTTYLVRFKYPSSSIVLASATPRSGNGGSAFNFNYDISGKRAIRPKRVFDDGQFTYFEFVERSPNDLPAFFMVDQDGKENLVNYRMEGSYVVVERVAGKFILRNGKAVVKVVNETKA